MGISFNNIPEKLRLPGSFIEFDPRLAGNANIDFKLLVTGQRLSTGTIEAGVPVRVTNSIQAEEYFGRGSMLAEQMKAIKNADMFMETWCVALDDVVAGQKATGTITVSGNATGSGTLAIYIAGYRVTAGVASGDTAAEIATAITAAITAATDQPVTATVNGGTPEQIDLTCRWKGETGNDLDLRLSYYDESQPESVSLSFTAMSGGTANPDIDDVFIAIGDQWFNWMVMPYTDTANLVALETELDSRWGPMRQIGCRAFSAYKGTHSETGTFGSNRNPVHVTSLGTNNAPEPPYLWASVNGIQGAKHLAIDPARQLRTIPLPGLKPPKLEDRWTDAERNLLLFDGISTYTVDHGGVVRIERQITMYQENELGFADDSYLDINTPETLERIRYEQRAMVAQKYPRHKLADDDYDVPVGQAIMQPKLAKVEFLALYKEFELKGWVQDYDGYKETFTAQINDDDPDRLDIYDSPKLINNLRVTAVHTEFRR